MIVETHQNMEKQHHGGEKVIPKKTNLFEQAQIPEGQLHCFNSQVLEEAKKIKIQEYSSGKPGDLIFVTAGAHGEEAKKFTAVDEIGDYLTQIDKGTVVVIPELNPTGCQNLTRYVFDDEKKTNLNNNYHYYKTGDWEELKKIRKNKTAQLSWLIMYYIKQRHDKNIQENGNQYNSMLIDIHREESVPFIRVDRKITDDPKEIENSQLIQAVLNQYRSFGLPIFLESPKSKKEKFYQSLTASCLRNQILGITIEEGNTYRPELNNAKFLQTKLLNFLAKLGFIIAELQLIDIDLSNVLKEAVNLWNIQQKTGEVYSLTGAIKPIIKYKDIIMSGFIEMLKKALNQEGWDGFFTQYFPNILRGFVIDEENKKENISDISFGYFTTTKKHVLNADVVLFLKETNEIMIIINVTEPMGEGLERLCHYGFFKDSKEKVILRSIGETIDGITFERDKALKPEEIHKLFWEGKKFDMSILNIHCAHLDPKWRGEKSADQIILHERGNN